MSVINAPAIAVTAAAPMRFRRALALAPASSGSSIAVPSPSTSVDTGHAKLPIPMYKNCSSGRTAPKNTNVGAAAANSAIRGVGFARLATAGSAAKAAAAAVSSGTKLAPGTSMAPATDRAAISRVTANQNPQNPARRANHALIVPAASQAIAAAATCIGSGCEIQESPLIG